MITATPTTKPRPEPTRRPNDPWSTTRALQGKYGLRRPPAVHDEAPTGFWAWLLGRP